MINPVTFREEAISLQQRRDWQGARSDSSIEKKFTGALLIAWNIADYAASSAAVAKRR